ncbi:hypothetical protein G7054_g616 [Neopestalotiopsis clavispora]|nr:hypothetical protein G7054_g616 [Neopestalotiopsis clavispora]
MRYTRIINKFRTTKLTRNPKPIRGWPASIPDILSIARDILIRDQGADVGVVAGPDADVVAAGEADALPAVLTEGDEREARGRGGESGPQRRDALVDARGGAVSAVKACWGFLFGSKIRF